MTHTINPDIVWTTSAKEIVRRLEEYERLSAINADLLEALQGLLAQNLALAHEIKSHDPLWCKWWDQARAAIAKAKGE